MPIQLIKHKAPECSIVKMVCDKPLHPKLDNFELGKFLNKHSTNLLVGRPGSGKTSLLVSFLESPEVLNKVYNNLFIVMPPNSSASLKKDIFHGLKHRYDELNVDTMNTILETIKEEDPKYTNAVIFDDMGSQLRNKETKKLFKELVYNRRHLRTSVYFLVQTYMSIEPDLRKMFSNLFIFKCSKKEMEVIAEEQIEEEKDCIQAISKYVFDKPHNFLFVNTDSGRLFKNYDEIVI